MIKRIVTLLLFALSQVASAQFPVSFGFGAQPNPQPLALPLATQANFTPVFLGSFKVPNSGSALVPYGFGAMSVCQPSTCGGSAPTLYMSADYYDPYVAVPGSPLAGGGVAAVTVPTLSGTPAYDGTNGTATVTCCVTGGATTTANRPTITTAPAPYTITPSAPLTGATSATFTSVPASIAPNAGWWVSFTGTNVIEAVTGVSGNTLSFAALPAKTYTTATSIHQWFPQYPFGNASGDRLNGTLVYNGNLYVSSVAYYDSSNATLGWILQSNLANTSWGAVYSTSGPGTVASQNCAAPGSPTIAYGRRYAGSLGLVPQIWQSLLGGPAYTAFGSGVSVISNNVAPGFGFSTFDPATITTAGGSITPTDGANYCYEGVLGAAWKKSLAARAFTGPFPTTGSTGYPATVIGGNGTGPNGLTGATAVALAVPSTGATVTANFTSGSVTMTVTAIQSGSISGSGISYAPSAPGYVPGSAEYITPAYDYAPGSVPTTCTSGAPCLFTLHTAANGTGTGITVTLTSAGYNPIIGGGYYQATFSDGGQRVGHLNDNTGTVTFPEAYGGNDNIDPTSFAPLACVSCTTAITILPMGDQWFSTYDGPVGTAIFVPGARTLAIFSMHQYGPLTARSDPCSPGGSGSNEEPLAPDSTSTTGVYRTFQVTAVDLLDIYNAMHGLEADNNCPGTHSSSNTNPWNVCPYARWTMPNSSSIAQSNGCMLGQMTGWVAYDPVGKDLYAMVTGNYNYASNQTIIYEWSVPTL